MRYENEKQELLCPLLLVDVQGGGGHWLGLPLLGLAGAGLVIIVAPQAVGVTRPEILDSFYQIKCSLIVHPNFPVW